MVQEADHLDLLRIIKKLMEVDKESEQLACGVSQTLFFLPVVSFLLLVEVVLLEKGSSPRRMAKTAKPKNGKYIINNLSDAFLEPTSSANMGTMEVKTETPKIKQLVLNHDFLATMA